PDIKRMDPPFNGRLVELYFQDGQLKIYPEYRNQNAKSGGFPILDLNAKGDFCTLYAYVNQDSETRQGFPIEAIVTLVSSRSHYGPSSSKGPAEDFSQGIVSSYVDTGARDFAIPGKGYNKVGNGKRDSGNVTAIGCESTNPNPISVNTLS